MAPAAPTQHSGRTTIPARAFLSGLELSRILYEEAVRPILEAEFPDAPYSKWLGSAFARLPGADDLLPWLRGAVTAGDYATRERHLCDAYERVAEAQNRTGPVGGQHGLPGAAGAGAGGGGRAGRMKGARGG
ncbi:hypothetical protein [Streptomyces sp. NPDC006415]|uniref:hypothetical protein n=1 Tax=Streptomyces sp. NPDC006415 TaxID=3155351 RepID=UPI0033B988F6